MKIRYGYCALLFLALSLLVVVACEQPGTPQPEAAPAEAEPAPPVEPTPLPAAVRSAVDEFATQQETIDSEWGLIRDDFDQWNAELSACLPGSMREALNEFAIGFNDVTEQARNVSRTQTTGELADILITAAEAEEAAFRQLRDRWQPNNATLFEQVEQARAEASRAHSQAEDKAIELRDTFEDAPDAESIDEFSNAFDAVKSDWQELHDEYTELREEAESLEVAEVLEGLDGFVKKMSDIISALDELPYLEGTENAVDDLLSAAKSERTELRKAAKPAGGSSSAAKNGSSSSAASSSGSNGAGSGSATGSGSTSSTQSSSTTKEEEPEPELPDFTDTDESVEAGDEALKQASRLVRSIADVDVEKNLGELQSFNIEHRRLRSTWDDFHDDYNDWRADEGGCDRAGVTGRLDEFSARVSSLSSDVKDLPQSGVLLPMYTLLVDAAEREEGAMRTVRYTWQPFTVDAFKALHEQRDQVDELRRQAGIAIQDLQTRP